MTAEDVKVGVTAPQTEGQGVTQPSRVVEERKITLPARVTFWEDGTFEVHVDGCMLTDGTVEKRRDWMEFIRESMEESQ